VTTQQATVRHFDESTRRGQVLLDDGTVVEFDRAAFDAGGLRLLRLGQRVRMHVDDAGVVRMITIATLPDPS
jgi:2-phospho-L-lactate guanylyltransferase